MVHDVFKMNKLSANVMWSHISYNLCMWFPAVIQSQSALDRSQKKTNQSKKQDMFKYIYIYIYCHGAHTRRKQEHADEDVNANNSL